MADPSGWRSAAPVPLAVDIRNLTVTYGKQMAVELVSYLRPEAKFASVEALKAQMADDVREAKRLLRG